MNKRINGLGFLLFLLLLGDWSTSQAQTILLRQALTNRDRVSVGIGELVNIEVVADLQGVPASGISVFISVPEEVFLVEDKVDFSVGTQPFVQGPLFDGAGQQANILLPETDAAAQIFVGQQIEFAAVAGTGNREFTGSGVVATFSLRCIKPILNGQILIDDNALRETKLVLPDGISEARFRSSRPMEITVTGLELYDIPDVILQPGVTDDRTIGVLDIYVQNSLAEFGSLQWSFEPTNLDSLGIDIDPITRRVTIAPHPEWTGRQRVIWTVTEPRGFFPGDAPQSASDFSDIVVNSPPSFQVVRDVDGVKRDTIRFIEDQHTYLPGLPLDPRRAFKGTDFDFIVEDPDIINPQDDLRFLTLGIQSDTTHVRHDIDDNTHELLAWSRLNFAGVDSFRVLVDDGLRGQDTLLVYAEISPVPDGPVFILPLEEREPKITRGGTKNYLFNDIVEDVDTPVDSLIFAFVGDPSDHFTVDTLRTADGLTISIKGKGDFSGTGRIVFNVADPVDPLQLNDDLILFFTAAEALPPVVFPAEAKIEISPNGPASVNDLDLFAEDPDNINTELTWIVPPVHRSEIGIDGNRVMSVAAPDEFIGFEVVILTVTDPSGQSDNLKLRIYSSDGRPVTGGMPDFILDRGDINQTLDLDEYYHDENDPDEEMQWDIISGFDTNNIQVAVDPITHVATFAAQDNASFGTEAIIFRVTSPEGQSDQDTVLVTIRSGGGQVGGSFQLQPLPEIQAQVRVQTQVFDLDDFVLTDASVPIESISWDRSAIGGDNATANVDENNVVSVFGFSSGQDTLIFTARDTLGNVQTTSAIVRIIGESEVLRIRPITDITFISGQTFTGINLDEHILDREAHPDSVVEWSAQVLDAGQGVFVQIQGDTTVIAFGFTPGETEVIFAARDTALNVVGRDTVRVIVRDPADAALALKDFPPLVVVVGEIDTSIVLNDFLPEGADGGNVLWLVSGQDNTLPEVGIDPPHRLRVSGVGSRVGLDTLNFTAELGGGFFATGAMEVLVTEKIDATTLDIQAIPNPINTEFVDIWVIARKELASTPTVVRNFAGVDSTVSMRQVESDLDVRKVLVWAGNVRLPRGAAGEVFFTSQAQTVLGTTVRDTVSVAVATTAGKRVALIHGEVDLYLPAGAVDEGTMVVLQTQREIEREDVAKIRTTPNELQLIARINAYPVSLGLRQQGTLRWRGAHSRTDGIYRRSAEAWHFAGAADQAVPIDRLGQYALLRDEVAPQIEVVEPLGDQGGWEIKLLDEGSGIDPGSTRLIVDGTAEVSRWTAEVLQWDAAHLIPGIHTLQIEVQDRAGNTTVRQVQFAARAQSLPSLVELAANYPNPFNPETVIPFALPATAHVRLSIYNSAGQLVRQLLDSERRPGRYEILWDGRDGGGQQVGSGVYLYRLQAGAVVRTRSLMLLK